MSSYGVDRRRFLKRAALVALAANADLRIAESAAQLPVPYSSGSEPPKLKPPAGSCDCHMHIYDSRFPFAPNAALKPPDARPQDYRLLQKRLHTARNVVVQPSSYGTDNRCTLDAVEQIGATARAVAVVDTSVTDAELKRLAAAGVRGIRFNLVQAGATTVDMLEPLSKRVHELGWHVQIHMLGDQIVENKDILQRLPSPIVFDHMGRIPASSTITHPAFGVISKLIDKGQTWVKLSSAYQDSKVGPPSYADMMGLAQAYVKAAPERMLWGSDWPHPTVKGAKPDDAILLDLLTDWAPDERTRMRILVENPQTLYGFAKAG
jgi:predicted TIM-barrel fold metal-dependent hydrolase